VSIKLGLSVRGCLAFVRCAKTWAASQGRTHVIPDDVKLLAHPVLCHRLLLTAEAQFANTTIDQVITQILSEVAPPAERVA
jgi:MoxR-like ATPase